VLWSGNFDSSYYVDSNSLNAWNYATATNTDASWKCYIAGPAATQPGATSRYVDLSPGFRNSIYNHGVVNKLGARFQINSSTTWGGNVRTGLVANYDFGGTRSGSVRYFTWSIKTPSTAPLTPTRIHQLVFFESGLFMLQLGSLQTGADNLLRFYMPTSAPTPLWSGTFSPDIWHNFVLKITFASSSNGQADLWYSQGSTSIQETSSDQQVVVAAAVPAAPRNFEYHHEVFLPSSGGAAVANEILYFDGSVIADAATDVFTTQPSTSTSSNAAISTEQINAGDHVRRSMAAFSVVAFGLIAAILAA